MSKFTTTTTAGKVTVRVKQSETELQQACIKWYRLQYQNSPLLISLPNGADVSDQNSARLVREGLFPGASDLLLIAPTSIWHGLFIEMKTDEGVQSHDQKIFQRRVENFGYKYIICRSFDEFNESVTAYMKTVKSPF